MQTAQWAGNFPSASEGSDRRASATAPSGNSDLDCRKTSWGYPKRQASWPSIKGIRAIADCGPRNRSPLEGTG